jgi:hypothetical protein
MGESSPDRMYGRAFARGYMGECSTDKYSGECSPDKYLGDSSPDINLYG